MSKRIVGLSIFLAVFLAVYGAMNYYVYLNLMWAFPVPRVFLLPMQILVFSLALAYPAGQFLKAKLHLPLLSYLGGVWMGILSIGIAVFVAKDIVYLFLPSVDFQAAAAVIVLGAAIWAAVKARRGPGVKRVGIQHNKLTQSLNIVHLSDLHLGAMTSSRWLDKVVAQVNSLNPDIVVITGDLIDDSYPVVSQHVPVMQRLKAKYGVYAVSGNHEYYQGIEHFREFCAAAHIAVADGECFAAAPGVNLAGLGGTLTTAGNGLEAKIRSLLTAANPGDYNILLIHHPVGFHKAAGLGVDLQLSGHTHRGQIMPFNLFVHMIYRHAYGLHTQGNSHIYTSSGTGTWGPPMRLGSSSEIVRIELICSSSLAT